MNVGGTVSFHSCPFSHDTVRLCEISFDKAIPERNGNVEEFVFICASHFSARFLQPDLQKTCFFLFLFFSKCFQKDVLSLTNDSYNRVLFECFGSCY